MPHLTNMYRSRTTQHVVLEWTEPNEEHLLHLQVFGIWHPLVFEAGLTLVCSFLSCLMMARFSLSFALSSRSCPTTSDVCAIQALIALSLLRWASNICGREMRCITHKNFTVKTIQANSDCIFLSCRHKLICFWPIWTHSVYRHTHGFIELFACLCGIHFAWERDSGHSGVQGMDDAIIYGAHDLQHLLIDAETHTDDQGFHFNILNVFNSK